MPVWDDNLSSGTEEEWAFKSRTFTGQIKHVDEDSGKLTVDLLGSRERYYVDAPVQGLSVRGLFSSWQRHMPQEKDFVDITFGVDNRPHLVRVVSWTLNEDSGGWAQIKAAADANPSSFGTIWRKLAQGEFDLRSKGGAGYYFDRFGHATLEAGTTVLELDKSRSESFGNAGLWVRRGDGVEVRFGDVKRLLPGSFDETSVGGTGLLPNPTAPAPKEWSRKLTYSTPPLGIPVLTLEVEQAGDVRDELGLPVPGPFGVPLRYRHQLFDASGLQETIKVEIDALGSAQVTQGALAAAGGVNLSMPTNPLVVSALSSSISTTSTNVLASAIPSGVLLGSSGAAEAFVKGTSYAAALNPLLEGLILAYPALAAFLTAYAADNPLLPSGVAATTAVGLVTPLVPLVTALRAAMSPGLALSLKVMGE